MISRARVYAGTQVLNLDIHLPIFAFTGKTRTREQALLARARRSVSAIVFREMAKLRQLGRIEMDLEDREVAGIPRRVHAWPIDLAVALASTCLDFRDDPAGELIAATSVVHRVPLVARDVVMRGSEIVPLA